MSPPPSHLNRTYRVQSPLLHHLAIISTTLVHIVVLHITLPSTQRRSNSPPPVSSPPLIMGKLSVLLHTQRHNCQSLFAVPQPQLCTRSVFSTPTPLPCASSPLLARPLLCVVFDALLRCSSRVFVALMCVAVRCVVWSV